MTAEITTVIGQLSIKEGGVRSAAPNQVAVREPKSADVPGAGKGDLFMITEIQGNAANPEAIEQKLAEIIRDNYYLSGGSVTASLRRAVQAGNELLYHRNRKVDVDDRIVGGVVVLVMCQEDAFVAQIGPSAFFSVLGDHIQRYPARSVWLDEAIAPAADEDISAMGLSVMVEPTLQHFRVRPNDILLLADSQLAGQLPLQDVMRAIEPGDMSQTVKNLGKVAQAHTCSAIALEVVEKSPAFGGLKFGAPAQLGNLWPRQRSQPPNGSPTPEPAAEPVTPELEAVPAGVASATFSSTSRLPKPFQWLTNLAHKAQPDPVDDLEDLDREAAARAYYRAYHPNYQHGEMDSVAPDAMLNPVRNQHKSGGFLLLVAALFRWIGLGLLTLVALIGTGFRFLLGLVIPRSGEREPRQAGLQAAPPTQSANWRLLRNIAIAIPLLVALIVGISYLQKGRLREAEYREAVALAQSKFEQAEAVGGNAALGLMAEAETALVQAEQIKPQQPEISELRAKMAEEADRAAKVQRLYHLPQMRQYTDAGVNTSKIVVQGVELFVMDTGNDRIFHHRLDDAGDALLPDNETVLIANKGQPVGNINIDEVLAMTWMPAGGNRQTSDLVILNSTGLLEFSPSWGLVASNLAAGDQLVRPVAVDSYFGNFYVLDPQANKLLRFKPTDEGYTAPPENYLTTGQPVDFSGAVDMAIDGAIYVLFKDGRLTKFLGGQPTEFNLTGLDTPLNNPVAVFAAPDEVARFIYVADTGNQRIVQLNKDGSFVRQFKPRPGEALTFGNLQDIFVDEIGGRLFVLDSNNLYIGTIPAQ